MTFYFQCPEEDFFSLHIRIVGDWTGENIFFLIRMSRRSLADGIVLVTATLCYTDVNFEMQF